MKAICSAGGFANALRCQPFLLIKSPRAYILTVVLEKATTDTIGLPRTYKSSGKRDLIAAAKDREAETMVRQESVYPLQSLDVSAGELQQAHFAPMWFITAHDPANSAPGRDPASDGLA